MTARERDSESNLGEGTEVGTVLTLASYQATSFQPICPLLHHIFHHAWCLLGFFFSSFPIGSPNFNGCERGICINLAMATALGSRLLNFLLITIENNNNKKKGTVSDRLCTAIEFVFHANLPISYRRCRTIGSSRQDTRRSRNPSILISHHQTVDEQQIKVHLLPGHY